MNLTEEEYLTIVSSSPEKWRCHELLKSLPETVKVYIINKYSGVFNYFEEVTEEQVKDINDRMEIALKRLHSHYMEIIGDIL